MFKNAIICLLYPKMTRKCRIMSNRKNLSSGLFRYNHLKHGIPFIAWLRWSPFPYEDAVIFKICNGLSWQGRFIYHFRKTQWQSFICSLPINEVIPSEWKRCARTPPYVKFGDWGQSRFIRINHRDVRHSLITTQESVSGWHTGE